MSCFMGIGQRSELSFRQWAFKTKETTTTKGKGNNRLWSFCCFPSHKTLCPLLVRSRLPDFIFLQPMGTNPACCLGVLCWSLNFGPKKNNWEIQSRLFRDRDKATPLQSKLGILPGSLGLRGFFGYHPSKEAMEYYQDQVNNQILFFLLYCSWLVMG